MDKIKLTKAFVAVFDKTVLDVLLPLLAKHNVKVVGTRGTVDYLKSKGVDAENVVEGYDYDGRVKTLGRANFVAILADKNKTDHVQHLKEEGIDPIDAVIVDLYKPDPKNFPETMDIGGQALIRAACKNYINVAVAFDRASINKLAEQLAKHNGEIPLSFRKNAAKTALKHIAQRTKLEADYFSEDRG